MNFTGVIIEESLEDREALKGLRVLGTEVEPVTEKHKTPWIKQWTLHTVEIPTSQAEDIASKLCRSLDSQHPWYADFKNDAYHYIVFRDKFFRVDRSKKEHYENVKKYGTSLGIPAYQLDFSPHI